MPVPFRVRFAGGAYQVVGLAPGQSEVGVERAIAGAVGLTPGTFSFVTLSVSWVYTLV